MAAVRTSDGEPFGPVGVGLVVVAGAPQRVGLDQELAAEQLDPRPLSSNSQLDGVRAVLVYLPAGLSQEQLEDLVNWAASSEAVSAIVGCAPLGTTTDSERALLAGFDDFVAGRFSAREIAQRVRAVLRRGQRRAREPETRRTQYGRLRIDEDERRVWVGAEPIQLTRNELAVVRVLIEAGGQSRSRSEILARAWAADELTVGERAVDNVIMRLRRKLPDANLIVTVRGIGFRLSE